jgi:hypothetical protein
MSSAARTSASRSTMASALVPRDGCISAVQTLARRSSRCPPLAGGFVACARHMTLALLLIGSCTDVDLYSIAPLIEPPPPPKPTGSICAPEGTAIGAPLRVVFIVDMSMSNVGTVTSRSEDGSQSHAIDSNNPEAPPSDLDGERFVQIQRFIGGCGAGEDTSYAVVGFGGSAVLGNGTTCPSPFESAESALETVADLAAMQRHDLELRRASGQYPFYLQTHTHYGAALECLASKMREDIALLEQERPMYQVFFLSDGAPDDPPESTSSTRVLQDLQQIVAESGTGLRFLPVLYYNGDAEGTEGPPIAAQAKLDELAHVVDPSVDTLLLGELAGSESVFCDYVEPRARVRYELASLYAINLNAPRRARELIADASASGLTDEEAVSLGFDPANARATGVLDRLCLTFADSAQACRDEVSRLGCDATTTVALGLTECDLDIAESVYGVPLDGIDTDEDRLPDFIEIIRGTSPARADALASPFGDGLTNMAKITGGLDVEANALLQPVAADRQMDVTFEPSDTHCPAGRAGYTYVFEQLPMTSTRAFVDHTADVLSLSHGPDENVVLLLSLWQATGGVELESALYLHKLLVSEGRAELETSEPIALERF